MNLKDYRIAVVANHPYFDFLQNLISSIHNNSIIYKEIIVYDVGLMDQEIEWLQKNDCNIRKTDMLLYDAIQHQGEEYKDLIRNRILIIKELAVENVPFVIIDSDTEILLNNFDLLDNIYDITYTTWDSYRGHNPSGRTLFDYHNLGVTFYHHPENCIAFIDKWIRTSNDPEYQSNRGQSDQFWLYYAKRTEKEYMKLKIQLVRAKYYNCFERDSYCPSLTSIVHYIYHQGTERTFKARYDHFWEYNKR